MWISPSRPKGRTSLANAGGCLLLFLSLGLAQPVLANDQGWKSTSWHSLTAADDQPPRTAQRRPPAHGSSFTSASASSFHAAAQVQTSTARTTLAMPSSDSALVALRALIASAEAGDTEYDAVQHQARILPPKAPTRMTIAEIFHWIEQTPGQHHAIGRYQIIPATLTGLVAATGLPRDTVFDARTQDFLANRLIDEAGYQRFRRGDLALAQFMDRLARIWAGLPLENGRSAYDGYAGNKATISRAAYEATMHQIFPNL